MSLTNYVKLVGCLSPRATITEAAAEMRAKGIGTVVVISDDYQPIGLITDRDVAVRVVAERKNPDQTTVESAMTRNVMTLPEDASVRTATELMRDKGVRRVPITDENGRVTGIVSFDDLLLLLGVEIGNLANAIMTEMSRSPDTPATVWQPGM
jgi:CBS domain-containing protein